MQIDTDEIRKWVLEKTKDIPETVADVAKKSYAFTEERLKALKNDYVTKENKIIELERALDEAVDYIVYMSSDDNEDVEEKRKRFKNMFIQKGKQ